MKQIIELNVPNTLQKEGVKGIFYEGSIICISYKNRLVTFKVNKEDQSRTIQRFDKLVGDTIDQPIRDEIKLCIAANWDLVLTSKTDVPQPELDREALELNRREHLARLDKLCRLSNTTIPPASPSQNKKKSYSSIFTTYVTIEENLIKEV